MSVAATLDPEPPLAPASEPVVLRVLPVPDCNPAPVLRTSVPSPVTRRGREVVGGGISAGVAWQQDALELVYALPSGVPAVPQAPRHLRLVADPASTDDERVRAWAARFVQAVVEVLSGDRPHSQLARWVDRRVRTEIRILAETLPSRAATGRRCRVSLRSLHLSEPTPGRTEVTAVVRTGDRVRALVLCLEPADDGWRCSLLKAV